MKNNLLRKSTLILCVLMMLNFLKVSAQQNVNLINAHLESERVRNSWLASDISGYLVSDQYSDERTGCTYTYIQQRHHNIAVFNAISTMLIKDNKVLYFAPALIDHLEQKIKTDKPSITAEAAIGYALIHLGREIAPAKLIKTDNSLNTYFFESPAISPGPIKVQLVYRAMDDGIYLAWDVSIEMKNESHWWNVRVNALTGDYLDKNDFTVNCNFDNPSTGYLEHFLPAGATGTAPAPFPLPLLPPSVLTYRVFALPVEAPSFGNHTLLTDPADLSASPFGWHDNNGIIGPEFTITRGNNVYACEDANGNNVPGYSPDGTASLNFDFPFNPALAPIGNQDASVTNLFYMNNRLHDVLYHFGFTEAAGNFQDNNYGNGGAGNDHVNADALDGSGTNNADFATPPDGNSPRMQMYLWTAPVPDRDGSFDNGVIAHEFGHGLSTRLTGGPANSSCLNNAEQGGEGWSDWLGLMMTIEPADTVGGFLGQVRGIGTYVKNQPTTGPGIRRFPYSTNMAINPQTYADLATSSNSHQRGEIWCDAIWDMSSFIIQDLGYNSDPAVATAGNNIVMRLVLEGMKLQPCSPGFLDARNAILTADTVLYNGAHACRIWEAFARRGMGFFAVQGSSNNSSDQTASFVRPPLCPVVTQPPVAAFNSNLTTLACAGTVNFADQSVQPQSWSWDFGDQTTSAAQNPSHTYNSPGTYTVKLVVTNTMGSDSVTHTITVTPIFTATATATPTAACIGSSVQLNAAGSGSSNVTYNVTSVPYAPLSGTAVNVPLADDGISGATPIGFTFSFFGQSYTDFYICSNGFITFSSGQPAEFASDPIPNAAVPDNFIALGWNDLNPEGVANAVSYFNTGVSPNKKLVVQYNTHHYNGAGFPFIIQAILSEGSNEIEIHTDTISIVSGLETTQGVENAGGTGGVAVPGRNNTVFSANNDAYKFTPVINYTYNWQPGNLNGAAQTVTPVASGAYTVTVGDGTGCFQPFSTPSVTVNPPLTPVITGNLSFCAGSSTTLDAGAGDSLYNWSTGATTQTISVNTAGTYTVTVTNAGGCTGSASVNVNQYAGIEMTCIGNHPTCVGNSDGTASVIVFGNGLYQYLWSTGATTSGITSLAAGTYTVTVTDANGCTATCESYVYDPEPINVSCSASPVTCFNGLNGTASVTASEGEASPTFGYLWSTGATTLSISGLPAGTYTVTVTDPNSGCTATCSSVVTQPSQILITETHSDATCGQTSGSIDVTVSGGTPGGYYVDNFNGSNSSASLISRGYVLYRNGTFSGTPGPLWGQGNGAVFPAFNGGPDGYVADNYAAAGDLGNIDDWMVLPAQNVTAGDIISFYSRSPLNDAWADSIRVMYNATGATLPADPNWTELGRFKVNTTGAWLQSIYNAPAAGASGRFAIRYSVVDGGLLGSNSDYMGIDALQLTKAGGPSYSYLWSDGNTNQDRSSLNGGTYTVTVTDGSGCTGSASATVTMNLPPPCIITGDDFCAGSSIQLCAATSSSYLWSTAATTQCITVTTGGTYTVTVTNASGCTSSCSKTVATYALPNCSISGNGAVCSENSAQWCASIGNVSYTWSTGATTHCITVNSASTFTVTVTDLNGCSSSCSKTLTEYPKPTCSITGSNFCSGSGSQLCTASIPGPGVNSYLWSTGATTQCITVTASGTYTVTVTDANGCTNSCSKTVTEYPKPPCSITGGDFCSGSSTQLCTSTAPAAPLFSYLWSTGATTQCITVTTGGTYTVTVTDANGCTNSCTKTVTAYPLPTCSITGDNFCSGSSSQLCAASVPGPSVNNYLWNTGATTQCIAVTASGTYTVTVTNASGCTSSCSKAVYAYQLPTCAITGNSSVCPGSTTQICGSVGTVSTYTYIWNTGATTQCITIGAGTYTVTATSTSGCTSSCSKTITTYPAPVCSITGGNFCQGSSTQLCAAANSGYLWSTGATTQCITVNTGGTYTVTVTNANGCTSSCSKTVNVKNSPGCSVTGIASICPGSATQWCAPAGLAAYLWSTGATTQCITVSTAATYTVTVANTTGCTKSCSKTLTVKALPNCNVTGTASICPGSSAQWCAPAGLAAYLWSSGATTQCITVNTDGTYTVTVTNTGGCTKSCSKALTIKGVPACSITGAASICPGGATQWCAPAGLAAYLWSNGATTQCISVSTAAVYTVTVTNAGGCTSSCSKTLTIKTPPSCAINGGNICQGGSTQLCVSAAAAGYLWSTGATTKCITVSTPGIYTVTVTGTNGCTTSCTKNVSVNPLPSCAITWNHAICPGGSAQFCAGTGLSSYLWNTGASSQCININAAGDYTVTVTGGNGCTNSCTVKVIVQQAPVCSITGNSVVAPGQTTPVCAPAGLTYLWNNGATTQCRNVAAGTYTVTVTNANGCTSSCSKTVTSATKMVEPVVISGDNGAIEASAYPNPFNREATIEFRNTIASGHVVVELFNLTGSKMAVLFDKDVEQNVTYQTKVHSEDLAEGVYFYRIVSGDNVITGKLILLKE